MNDPLLVFPSQVSAVCLTSYTASVLTLIASTLLVSQIQPLISSFSGIISTSITPTSPSLSSIDQIPMESYTDPRFSQNHQSPVDVLTTSFILASISSCGERLVNDSGSCSDKEKSAEESIGHPLFGTRSDYLPISDNIELTTVEQIDWNYLKAYSSWMKWVKELNGWFRTPILGSLESPPDWATTLSYCIDRSASTSQSRLIPLQVY